MKPRLLFHVQHFLGMGHLIRAMTLADALTEQFAVTLVSGGSTPNGIVVPGDIELVQLPPLSMSTDMKLMSPDGSNVEQVLADRGRRLLALYEQIEPSVLLVELFPFGRKKLAPELIPLLERAAADPARPIVATSVRDILVTGRHDQAGHDIRAGQLADRFMDLVLVHGDADFASFFGTFNAPPGFSTPLVHTGFVARPEQSPTKSPTESSAIEPGSIIVSAGGGWVGDALMHAAQEAAPELWARHGTPMTLIPGPLADPAKFEMLVGMAEGRPELRVVESVPDLLPVLRGAAASISQCGYNTTLDLLRAQVPTVVVPFGDAGENEQLERARRLSDQGLAEVLLPAAANGESLAAAVSTALEHPPPKASFSMDGARMSTHILAKAWADRSVFPPKPGGTVTPPKPGGTVTPPKPGGTVTPPKPGGTVTPPKPGGTVTPPKPGGTVQRRFTMTSWLDPLRVELDLSPGPLQFFFRDDDAGWDDDALFAMCDRFAGRASLDVAAIPTAMSPGLAKALLSRSDHVFVHQHGYAHINHRGMGKKCEFGDDRPAVDVQQDLRHGAAILTSLFGDSLQPIFTPPWNRCSEEAARAAATAGMRILSRDRGEEPFGIDALCEVPVAVDWVRHRAELGHTIASACAGTPIETPVGIMLHHAVFDRSDLERIDALLQLLSTHNNAQLCSIADVAHRRVGHLGVGL